MVSTGVWKRINTTTIEITELPIGKWTQVYKEFLDSLVEENEIIDYKNNSDDLKVDFKVVMQKNVIDDLISKNLMDKKLKLTSSINTSNMHVFDADCKIRKVATPEEIIYRFYKVRKAHFIKRKKYLIDSLNKDYLLLESKVKFIRYVIKGTIEVFNKKKDFIVKQIIEVGDLVQVNDSWDYLLDLKLWTLTQEKILDLETKMKNTYLELDKIKKTSIEEMWTSELKSIN